MILILRNTCNALYSIPAPVAPYANTVTLYPSITLEINGFVVYSYTCN